MVQGAGLKVHGGIWTQFSFSVLDLMPLPDPRLNSLRSISAKYLAGCGIYQNFWLLIPWLHSLLYSDTGRGLYFYLKGDNWEVGASLPSKLKAGLGDSVTLELDTAKPYIHHAEHAMKYGRKSSQIKIRKNGKRG